jgi:hypothetical protein
VFSLCFFSFETAWFWKPTSPMSVMLPKSSKCTNISAVEANLSTEKAKRKHTKRLLAKIYYSPLSKIIISLRLVQNACRNYAIALEVNPRGPKYDQEP